MEIDFGAIVMKSKDQANVYLVDGYMVQKNSFRLAKKMKRLLLVLLLFSSPVFAHKDRIYYVHVRPPSSYSGTIGDDGFFYYFTNSADRVNDDICKIRIDGGCFVKTDVPAKIIRKGIMEAGGRYWCSEDHIQARKKADPKPVLRRGGGYMDYGYGICTKNGWITRSLDEI